METCKVTSVTRDCITFSNGYELRSHHDQDCCETHELTLTDINLDDFDGLEFSLSGDEFFRKVPDFGIELVPISGHPVKIPAHGYNNGYYGTNLTLVLVTPNGLREYDITECQDIQG
jgi:hypothetical protein